MLLFDPALAPFTIALLVMALIAMLELVSLMFGASASGMVDNLLPDGDAEIAVPDAASGLSQPGALESFFGWLGLGRVPALILLAALLASFGIIGLVLQSGWRGVFGSYLPAIIPTLVAAPLALFPTRWIGRVLQRLLPKEESQAVSSDSFVGRVAVVVRGEASTGRPAEAKLKDPHGATHYLLVEPDDGGERFAAGSEVLIVARAGAVFKAIANPSTALTLG
jgi:hypothetical protein